jgi:DNA-binding transcriptional MerR regulator
VRIGELAAQAGTTVRTVRYYVAQGLLPGPVGLGPRSAYTYEHLVRLGAIRALKARYLPLAEIGRQLAGLTLEEMEALAAAPEDGEPLDAVGRPLGGSVPTATRAGGGGLAAARAGAAVGGFGLPSARRALRRGTASSTPLPPVGSNLWQRVLLAPGVELSFQLSGDDARDAAIVELIEQATRRLAGLGARRSEEER